MAAIIAQMAAANRERKKRAALNVKNEFATNKSDTFIPMFDRCFDPKVHNTFVRNKTQKESRTKILDEIQAHMLEEEDIRKEIWRERIWKVKLKTALEETEWPQLGPGHPDRELIENAVMKRLTREDKRAEMLGAVSKCLAGFIALTVFAFIIVFLAITFMAI